MSRKRYEFYKQTYRKERKKYMRRKAIEILSSIVLAGAFLKFGCRPILEKIFNCQQSQHALRAQVAQKYVPETNEPEIIPVSPNPSNLETKIGSINDVKSNNVINDANNTASVNYGGQKKKIIVLDPGHGFNNKYDNKLDPGAIYPINSKNPEFKEADIVLKQAKKIKQMLEIKGYEVYLTRNDAKESTPLNLRTKLAEKLNADLFVSLHCNGFEDDSVYGQEVFYNEKGKEPAQYVQSSLLREIKKTGFKTRDRGIKTANYEVLKTAIPAVHVEPGFLRNENDKKFLTDKIPDVETAITNGIDSYFRRK